MAPVEFHRATSLVPAGVVFLHIFSVGYLSAVAGRVIYRSYLTLPPSSATRYREPLRRGHVRTFSLLAIASLTTAFYFFMKFSGLSYRVWAIERGVELPENLFGDKGAFRSGEHPGRLHIFKWLSDTPFYLDMLEIVVEKARYFWWSQQISLAFVPWSIYLAIEGGRRKIPYLWAFMALAQLVNLSYGQNLFFLAILLTPVPLPPQSDVKDLTRDHVPMTSSRYSKFIENVTPSKPNGWVPKAPLWVIPLLLSYATIFLTPFAFNTPSFMMVASLSRGLLFLPLVIPYIVPQSWGTVHNHPHEAYTAYTRLFSVMSWLSIFLHVKSSAFAIGYNTPDREYYRHSRLLNVPYKKKHRSPFDRGSAAFGKLFGAVGDHFAVGAAGWDVMLSGLSLGVWAATRNLDPVDIVRSVGIPIHGPEKKSEEVVPPIKSEDTKASTSKRAGRPKKAEKRTKPNKTSADDTDSTYSPSDDDRFDEGDEGAEDNWEIGACTWGILTTTGLGVVSAGVFGAEVVAR